MLFELFGLIVGTAVYTLAAAGSVLSSPQYAGGMPSLSDLGALASGAIAAATAAVTGGLSLAGPLSGAVGDAVGDAAAAAYDAKPGDNVTGYIPGVSPLPEVGDIVYVPGMGASTVTEVQEISSGGNVHGHYVQTELGGVGYHTMEGGHAWGFAETLDPTNPEGSSTHMEESDVR